MKTIKQIERELVEKEERIREWEMENAHRLIKERDREWEDENEIVRYWEVTEEWVI